MCNFSVVIPAFNAEKTIRKCLDSILNQTHCNFEVVVIDDGSTDGTAKIVSNYVKLDPRVKLFKYENAGVSEARHRGIINANGHYIVFVDSDDEVNPELLEKLAKVIKKHNLPDVVRYQCKLINDVPYKNHDRYNFYDPDMESLTGIEALKAWSLSERKYAVYWLYAFKKELFRGTEFPTLKCYEDLAVIPTLIAKAQKVVTISYVGYKYTYNNSQSITNMEGLDKERERALDFLEAYKYAVLNLRVNPLISNNDFLFLLEDYNIRLQDKFESLPKRLKEELKLDFMFVRVRV